MSETTPYRHQPRAPEAAGPAPELDVGSRRTRRVDRLMGWVIRIGGVGILLAVFALFFFIFIQVLPLFRGAKVALAEVAAAVPGQALLLGVDDRGERPFVVAADGSFTFIPMSAETAGSAPPPFRRTVPGLAPDFAVSATAYRQRRQQVALAASNGETVLVELAFPPRTEAAFDPARDVTLTITDRIALIDGGATLTRIDFDEHGSRRLVAGTVRRPEGNVVVVQPFSRRRSLFGEGSWQAEPRQVFTGGFAGQPVSVLVNAIANRVVVATDRGSVHVFFDTGSGFAVDQVFAPFADQPSPRIATMRFLLGGVSICFTSYEGENRVYSLYREPTAGMLQYGLTKEFPAVPGTPLAFAASPRNRGFLVAGAQYVSLRYSTTETVRWGDELDFIPQHAVFGGKYDRFFLLGRDHRLRHYTLDDPHPQAGLRAFFGRIWYEGQPAPVWKWQSSGGSDVFEPKLSLVPLLFGSLKGTFYALLFAVPIAISAAIYTSQFARPEVRRVIKPTMEIMAAVPTVVLGFLGALWLAPLLAARVPSFLLIFAMLPVATWVLAVLVQRLGYTWRRRFTSGWEFALLVPFLVGVAVVAWHLGPWLERLLFVVEDPVTGARVADFRLWWPEVTGTPFEQRNAVVVGFMMGFAVIPFIFTILEDALENVPRTLVYGSMALGANRWQTTWRVVLPMAGSAVFSALMIGFGRAAGETMIVMMATGNSPVMDPGFFTGMRTLAANIAIELPEAPQDGTLFRTLFLGALVLFVFTFIVNTIAELLRHRLRSRYRTYA